MTPAYEELVDFIAGGATSSQVARFKPSRETKNRVWELLRLAKQGDLLADQRQELEHYLHLEHVMRLAKAKARLQVNHE